ncbi:hypothetical protein R4446_16225 [Acinetobacter baumannii]|nr:hypothetical protein [Acinetobacter baumannii]
MCTIDWDITYKFFQTILTIAIACVVYLLWHNQKGKEVISSEAKEVFKLLELAASKSQNIFEQMLIMATQNKVPSEFDKVLLTEFRDMNLEILKRLDFIKYKNSNKKTILLIEKFSEFYTQFLMHYFRNDNYELDLMMHDKDKYIESTYELRQEMYEYALYKKIL